MTIDETHFDADSCGGNAAPYVLGALTEEEHEQFARHLRSCAVCREEVASLQVVAASLPSAAPRLSAPPELKLRVMADVHADARRREQAEGERRQAHDRGTRPARRWRGALAFTALAAVAAAVVLAAVAIVPSGGSATRVIRAATVPASASASLRVSSSHAELEIAGMPVLPPDRVYEVWVKRGAVADPTDALFTVTSTGAASVDVPGDLSDAQAVMVTAEPLGGSRVPTSRPVIVASLS